MVTSAMDSEATDSSTGVADALNGETKPDPARLAQTAIIKQDVMLSGNSTQSPVSSVFTMPNASVSMSAGSMATSLSSIPDSLFLSAVSSLNDNNSTSKEDSGVGRILANTALAGQTQLLGQPQVAAPQIILTGNTLQQSNNQTLPVQQILIPVSTGGNGTQQLLSIPVSLAAGAGGQIQLLTSPNGQILATNLPGVQQTPSVNNLSLNAANQTVAAQSLANQLAQQTSGGQPGLTQIITNAQGQILAIGAPQVSNMVPQTVAVASSTSNSSNANSHGISVQPSGQTAVNMAQVRIPQVSSLNAGLKGVNSLTGQLVNQQVITQSTANALSTSTSANINQLLPNNYHADTVSNSSESTTVDGINLDEIKEFAKQFKIRRLSLGLTQTQVGQALSATEGPSYSQSAICRFEKLDITPKSAQKIKPVLERWMAEAEERYKNGVQNLTDFIGSEPSKKRKRRTSFTPAALEILNDHFERNTHPSGAEMTELSEKLNYDREVIRVWFCNKRQALKNTIKKLKGPDGSQVS